MSSDLHEAFDYRTNADPLFKVKFGRYYENQFNSKRPAWSQVKKNNSFVAKRLEFPVPTTYKGGVGSGRLPESKSATYATVQVTAKRVYATDKVDRESVIASIGSEAAFVEAMAETIKKVVEADIWNHTRIFFNDGTGALGTINAGGVTNNGGGNYDIVISAATWKEANWEENMFVNFAAAGALVGGTEKFEITAVAPSTRTISLQRQAGGAQVPADADVCYLQGSFNADPMGLKGACDAVGGNLYGVPVGRKWQAYQRAAGGIGISTPILNKAALTMEKKTGVPPNRIFCSYVQYEKILNLMEDQKRYSMCEVGSSAKNLKGKVSFPGVQFLSTQGPVAILPDQFIEDDRIYLCSMDHIEYHRRPRSGWVKDDIGGNGYLRVVDEDAFEARYATYGDIFICPTFQGVITGLAT